MSRSQSLITRPGALQAPALDYFLLDGSSSMWDKWHDTLAAMDGYMDVLKSQNINSHGIVQVFDTGEISRIERDSKIADWPKFSTDPIYAPGGMTPLFDAINIMARTLRDMDPPNCCIIICTDGEENGSRHTTSDQAKALLDWCRAKGWQVVYLGADFNNEKQARLLGANPQNSIGVRKELLKEAGKTIGNKRLRHIRNGEDINFTDEEKTTFGGYLTGPSA